MVLHVATPIAGLAAGGLVGLIAGAAAGVAHTQAAAKQGMK